MRSDNAADDVEAGTTVAAWVDALGFDPVRAGLWVATYAAKPRQPLVGATRSAAALGQMLPG